MTNAFKISIFALATFTMSFANAEETPFLDMNASTMSTTTFNENSAKQAIDTQEQQQQLANTAYAGAGGNTGGSGGSAMGAMGTQLVAVGAAIGVAKALQKPCSSLGSAAWACPMMAMSLVQAGLSGGSSGQSRQSASQFSTGSGSGGVTSDPNDKVPSGPNPLGGASTGPNGTGNGNGTNPALLGAAGNLGPYANEYNAMVSELGKSGYSISPDGSTITTPDGKKIPSSAYSSPDAMRASGAFSDAQIEAASQAQKAAMAAAKNNVRGIGMAVEGGAGGGAGYTAPTGGGSAGGGGRYGGYNFRMPRAGGARQPKVSGLSKQLGNDKIGLAGDDIFEMIHIRYDARDKAGNFVSEK